MRLSSVYCDASLNARCSARRASVVTVSSQSTRSTGATTAPTAHSRRRASRSESTARSASPDTRASSSTCACVHVRAESGPSASPSRMPAHQAGAFTRCAVSSSVAAAPPLTEPGTPNTTWGSRSSTSIVKLVGSNAKDSTFRCARRLFSSRRPSSESRADVHSADAAEMALVASDRPNSAATVTGAPVRRSSTPRLAACRSTARDGVPAASWSVRYS